MYSLIRTRMFKNFKLNAYKRNTHANNIYYITTENKAGMIY